MDFIDRPAPTKTENLPNHTPRCRCRFTGTRQGHLLQSQVSCTGTQKITDTSTDIFNNHRGQALAPAPALLQITGKTPGTGTVKKSAPAPASALLIIAVIWHQQRHRETNRNLNRHRAPVPSITAGIRHRHQHHGKNGTSTSTGNFNNRRYQTLRTKTQLLPRPINSVKTGIFLGKGVEVKFQHNVSTKITIAMNVINKKVFCFILCIPL